MDFMRTDVHLPSAPTHGFGRCACHPAPTRRGFNGLFTGLVLAGAAGGVAAREGVEVKEDSWAIRQAKKALPAAEVERQGAQQYQQMMAQAQQQRALLPGSHPQVERLRFIAQRMLPFAPPWNPRAPQWQWEVNLIASDQLNAFCIPGGKIAFYTGILVKLQLSDDEVATIMGHEVAHALREHARERMVKTLATRVGANVVSSLLGLGDLGNVAVGAGAQLLTMRFSREDESEADLVGMELAARAGYDPRAGVSLWQKMGAANRGAPPQWMSTHPAGPTRIQDIEKNLPKVNDLFARAPKPPRRFPVATPQG